MSKVNKVAVIVLSIFCIVAHREQYAMTLKTFQRYAAKGRKLPKTVKKPRSYSKSGSYGSKTGGSRWRTWWNRPRTLPTLPALSTEQKLLIAGAAAGTYTWKDKVWDKVREFFGYETGYDIVSSTDYPDYMAPVIPIVYKENSSHKYSPGDDLIPYYSDYRDYQSDIQRDVVGAKAYNISKTKNGSKFTLQMGPERTSSSPSGKTYVPTIMTLTNSDNIILARYIFHVYFKNTGKPGYTGAQAYTADLIASSLVGEREQNNIPAHRELLTYAENQLKKSGITSIGNDADGKAFDLWRKWGYNPEKKLVKENIAKEEMRISAEIKRGSR